MVANWTTKINRTGILKLKFPSIFSCEAARGEEADNEAPWFHCNLRVRDIHKTEGLIQFCV